MNSPKRLGQFMNCPNRLGEIPLTGDNIALKCQLNEPENERIAVNQSGVRENLHNGYNRQNPHSG